MKSETPARASTREAPKDAPRARVGGEGTPTSDTQYKKSHCYIIKSLVQRYCTYLTHAINSTVLAYFFAKGLENEKFLNALVSIVGRVKAEDESSDSAAAPGNVSAQYAASLAARRSRISSFSF